jgi:hypothetical protein
MTQKGLVAFFDILGYQDIINNNLIDDVAKIISEIILGLPRDAKKIMLERFPDVEKEINDKDVQMRNAIAAFYSKINARIISDSIIIAMEVPQNTGERKEGEIGFHYFMFLCYVADLFFKSFDKGLPLRGAIDYGEFFLNQQCFAGKPLVECYGLSNDLELAGCVITQNTENYFNELPLPGKLGVKCKALKNYLVPFKNEEKRMAVIDWSHNIVNQQKKDIRQYIVNQFKSHNKDISEKVMRKLNNTEIMLRCLLKD